MTEAIDNVTRRGPRDRARLLCGQRRYGLIYLVSILAGMMIWLAVSRHFAGFILAPPQKVIERLWELTLSARLPIALLDASRHMLLGFAIAQVIALPLGMLMGRLRVIHDLFDPLVTLIYAVPSGAWAPFIMIWFGLYFEARVALVVIMYLFDMLIIIDAGTRNVDRRLLDVGRAFRQRRRAGRAVCPVPIGPAAAGIIVDHRTSGLPLAAAGGAMRLTYSPLLLNLTGCALALLAWQIGGMGLGDALLATPGAVAVSWLALLQDAAFWRALATMLMQMLAGYLLALAVGIPLGIAMGRSRWGSWRR